MDLAVAMLAIVGLGIWRMVTTDGNKPAKPVMNEDGTVTYPDSALPIGENLELLYEVDAYTYILKELGLM